MGRNTRRNGKKAGKVMPDTPEETARRRKLLQEIWELEGNLDLSDPTPEEIVEAVKQVRKEMAEERKASEGNDKINPTRKVK